MHYNFLKVFIPVFQNSLINKSGTIDSVFGSFPNVIWNGGRNLMRKGEFVSLKTAEEILNFYRRYNIPIRFTFSNSLIEKKHLNDYYSNEILSMINPKIDWVIISSPMLYQYIKNRYPNIRTIHSVTTLLPNELDVILQHTKDYDLVVLPSELNYDGTLEKIDIEKRKKIEILVNEGCKPYCPYKLEHYYTISKANLEFDAFSDTNFCGKHYNDNQKDFAKSLVLNNEQVEKICQLGYTYFKISSRHFFKDPVKLYCKYLLGKDDAIMFYNDIFPMLPYRNSRIEKDNLLMSNWK
jgi:collagenase-like PrtC family protease